MIQIHSKIPIQASILLGMNKSLKTIKSEILLTFVTELFEDYKKLKNNNCEKQGVISIYTLEEDDKLIERDIENLLSYFKQNVVTKEHLIKIFGNAYTNEQGMLLAKQCEPLGVYYEKLATLLKHYIPVGGLFIPEYFGLLLITYYKESANSFSRFLFVQDYNFQELFDVYAKVNITLKKEMMDKGTHKRLWECRTTIDEMEKIAFKLIKEYNSFQYKINIMRKSKTRRNKR